MTQFLPLSTQFATEGCFSLLVSLSLASAADLCSRADKRDDDDVERDDADNLRPYCLSKMELERDVGLY